MNRSDWLNAEKEISILKNEMARNKLHNVFENVDVPSEVFNRLLRPITFGYLEAKAIHSLCRGESSFSEKMGEIGGIYVAWVSYFDELCDSSPDAVQYLKNNIDKKSLSSAINDASPNKNIFLRDLSKDVDSQIIPLFLLWQTYIHESKNLYDSSKRKDVWEDFVNTISTQYIQEIDCIEAKIPEFQPDIWQMIRNRSSSPLWVNFLIGFLSIDTNLNLYSSKLKNSILKLGEVAKIVDDITDLTDDLSNRRWNYVLIKAHQRDPKIFDNIERNNLKIIQWIVDEGVVAESIDDACISFQSAMNDLKKMGLFNRDFEQHMRLFLSNWFKYDSPTQY